ncbi:MAG: lysophospholipid acyltransferase family protein [Pseudomonadota bacterium]
MHFKNIGTLFFSYVYIAFVAVSSVFFFTIACLIRLVSMLVDQRLIVLNLFSSFWASFYLWCVPIWSVKIIGRRKMDIKKSYVIVSNHQSQLDILLIYRLFFPMRWVSKEAVFKLPFLGWNMVLNGYIKLKRGDKKSIANMMEQCEQLLTQNISIMIFPEGTRSETGFVKPFKPGAFILAKKMKKPILPMVINNSYRALPKYSLKISGRHHMTVRVLDEIPYSAFKDMEIDDIARMVRQLICSHVNEHILHQ